MSSHCNRYPACGCPGISGDLCGIPDEDMDHCKVILNNLRNRKASGELFEVTEGMTAVEKRKLALRDEPIYGNKTNAKRKD